MEKLDDKGLIKKYDPDGNLDSVGMLADQVDQVWKEFKKVKIPEDYSGVTKILLNGMGGSALGADMLRAIYFDKLKIPFEVINSYDIPASLDEETLYIICSYSGSTEEPISSFLAAQKTGAKIFGITAGQKLGELIEAGKIPGYIFNPVANPSNQPRIGLGYTLTAELALLKRLGLIKLSDQEIEALILNIKKFSKQFGFDKSALTNEAKKVAKKVAGKSLTVVSSEHLAGNAHVFSNQANETGKTLASYRQIPELNHHLLEGLKFPATNKGSLVFFFAESNLYHQKNQLRYAITKKIVSQNKVSFVSYKLKSTDKLNQAFELLTFSSYVTFYLAMLNKVNPNLIPYVDSFKAQLKKNQ